MTELFQKILENYRSKETKVDSRSEVYDFLCRKLPNEIRMFLNRNDFIVKGSMGQGNKSDFPWIAVMNRDITTSTQRGLYVVYLFKSDMSGFYLTLMQGITHFEEMFNKKKYEYAVKVANYFKSQIDDTSFSKLGISLGSSKHDLGYGYEKTTILSKFYSTGNFNEELLKADLHELIEVYDFIVKHMETRNYDKIIEEVLREESVMITSEEAVKLIKNTVDPDDDLPFGFNRELLEVVPYVDRTNKFRRITMPRLGKIDYLKKAAKDIKAGLMGEQLVLKYEEERLIRIGHEEMVDKIKWAAEVSDSFGYDIDSFDIDLDGKLVPIKIEVKSTISKVDKEFFVSKKEIDTSKIFPRTYFVYRVYDINSEKPKFYRALGPIEDNFIIDPVTFMARYKFPEYRA